MAKNGGQVVGMRITIEERETCKCVVSEYVRLEEE